MLEMWRGGAFCLQLPPPPPPPAANRVDEVEYPALPSQEETPDPLAAAQQAPLVTALMETTIVEQVDGQFDSIKPLGTTGSSEAVSGGNAEVSVVNSKGIW